MSTNKVRTTITQAANVSLVKAMSFLLFLSQRRVLKRIFNPVEIMRILLEDGHLNSFEKSFNKTYKHEFKSILDDKIFCYWCLGTLNLRFNVF